MFTSLIWRIPQSVVPFSLRLVVRDWQRDSRQAMRSSSAMCKRQPWVAAARTKAVQAGWRAVGASGGEAVSEALIVGLEASKPCPGGTGWMKKHNGLTESTKALAAMRCLRFIPRECSGCDGRARVRDGGTLGT